MLGYTHSDIAGAAGVQVERGRMPAMMYINRREFGNPTNEKPFIDIVVEKM
jgi:hypothetical protein